MIGCTSQKNKNKKLAVEGRVSNHPARQNCHNLQEQGIYATPPPLQKAQMALELSG